MSGRAASRECRNAGNRPASWNVRTGLGERGLLVATAGAPRWQASPWRTAADSLKRFVCNALASARNHPLSG